VAPWVILQIFARLGQFSSDHVLWIEPFKVILELMCRV
jgi:hypothetical protein